ncbi:MAG TPA: hypothetical protein VJK71_00475, partial [Gemmatimonadales bacterium]|nr:hypothetical protein [Gemmatimonadales bacterium]
LVPWDLIAARVTAGPEGGLVFEHIPHVFPAELKDELLRRLRRAFKRYRKDDPALDEAACFRRIAPLLNHIWLDQVALRPLPAIRTPEGDALVITKVHYEMEDPRAIRELLNRHPGLVAEGDAFVWLEGDEDRSGRRVLGRIELEAKRLRLETWSERRAESGRRLLEDLLGNRVRYRTTTCEDALQAARRAPPPKEPREAIPAGVEAEVLREYLDRHYLAWLDEPVPALGGRTPRHSARLKTGRPKLIGLLKAMETRAARDRLEGRPAYDTAWLWAELGLARSPHDQSGGGEADARSADGG